MNATTRTNKIKNATPRRVAYVDWRDRVTVPVRDAANGGAVAFLVDVYGVSPSDLSTVGGGIGSRPLMKAVKRLGLDPNRFFATLWDVPQERAP